MAHTVRADFTCHPGKGGEMLELMRSALVDTRAFDGCESLETYSDQGSPDRIMLWEKWATREQYDAYLAWRVETGLMDLLAPYMDPAALRIIHLQPHDDV